MRLLSIAYICIQNAFVSRFACRCSIDQGSFRDEVSVSESTNPSSFVEEIWFIKTKLIGLYPASIADHYLSLLSSTRGTGVDDTVDRTCFDSIWCVLASCSASNLPLILDTEPLSSSSRAHTLTRALRAPTMSIPFRFWSGVEGTSRGYRRNGYRQECCRTSVTTGA